MKKLIIVISLLLALFATDARATVATLTNYPHNPMPTGQTKWAIYEITGHLVRISTGQVLATIPDAVYDYRMDILTQVPHAYSPQYTENSIADGCPALGMQSYIQTRNLGGGSLWTAQGFAYDGSKRQPYLGEGRDNLGHFQIPPEPQLPLWPAVGQVMDVHSTIYTSCDNPTVALADYRTTLYVLAHIDDWNGYTDNWITVLTERNGTQYVYEYVFARDIGLVDAWYGYLSNGIVTGYRQMRYKNWSTPTPTPTITLTPTVTATLAPTTTETPTETPTVTLTATAASPEPSETETPTATE